MNFSSLHFLWGQDDNFNVAVTINAKKGRVDGCFTKQKFVKLVIKLILHYTQTIPATQQPYLKMPRQKRTFD